MADIGMPDVLTPDQMVKLGGAAHPDDLPDTVSADQMERATEKPQSYPPLDDEKLGIYDGPLKASGTVFDRSTMTFRNAADLGRPGMGATSKPLPVGYQAEKPLIREDPAMNIATTIAGGGVGKVVGKGVAKLSPIAAKLVEPAVAGATTSALQGGNAKQNLIAAGIGGALGLPGAVLTAVRGAPAAVAERLPQAVTGGAKTKIAKQAGGAVVSDIANHGEAGASAVLDAHPELKKVLSTGNLTEKFNATGSTLNKLTAANDTVYDAIQSQHQGIPFEPVAAKIKAVAEHAHQAGDATLEDAANAAIDNLQRFTDVADKRGAIVTATQLRGVRNNLARRVQAINPTLGATDVQAAADEIKRAINDGIADIAGQTKGVDVAALRARNQQIAALLPVQRALRGQVIDKNLLGPEDKLADLIEHPQREIAGLVRKAPAHIDAALASNPTLQRLAQGAKSPLSDLATRSLMAGTAAEGAKRSKQQQSDLEYAARVSQLMGDGKSLHEAVNQAEAEQ
jgi:hypothetical protein